MGIVVSEACICTDNVSRAVAFWLPVEKIMRAMHTAIKEKVTILGFLLTNLNHQSFFVWLNYLNLCRLTIQTFAQVK
jgi:hypothetical protein